MENHHSTIRFSAVILAGGRSTRMGCDKAWLEWEGQPLIRHQLATVCQVQPQEIFISAPDPAAFDDLGCPVLADNFPGQGPLAGIERALTAARTPLLLVLAVDMPFMTAAVLRKLVRGCGTEMGAIPSLDHHLEPLAAVYPKSALRSLREFLGDGFNSAADFADWTLRLGLATRLELSRVCQSCFANWNRPEDIPVQKFCSKSKLPA